MDAVIDAAPKNVKLCYSVRLSLSQIKSVADRIMRNPEMVKRLNQRTILKHPTTLLQVRRF
ncbi:hypothetical protein OK016_25100 [Vibrio chagasii]|nr:hypothetical protein [Vibrio chagasii]